MNMDIQDKSKEGNIKNENNNKNLEEKSSQNIKEENTNEEL